MRNSLLGLVFKHLLILTLVSCFSVAFYLNIRHRAVIEVGYPQGVILFLWIFLVWGFIAEIRSWLKSERQARPELLKEFKTGWLVWGKSISTLIVLVIYIGLINYLGYYLSTLLFVGSLSYILGARKIKKQIIFMFLLVGSIYLIFQIILSVPVPRGIFG